MREHVLCLLCMLLASIIAIHSMNSRIRPITSHVCMSALYPTLSVMLPADLEEQAVGLSPTV